LHSPGGTFVSTRMRVEGDVMRIEFRVHDAVLSVELRAQGADRFTGSWTIGDRSEIIAGKRQMVHN
jgi:hypothetical protein